MESGSSFDSEEAGNKSSDSPLKTPKKSRGRRGRQRSKSPVILLEDPLIGDIVWAKVQNHRWWPAVLVEKEDCGELVSRGGRNTTFFVYWYGDGRVSPIALSRLVEFKTGFKKFIKPTGSISFRGGVYRAILDYRELQQLDSKDLNFDTGMAWAEEGFPLPAGSVEIRKEGVISMFVREKLRKLRVKHEEVKNDNVYESTDRSMYLKYTKDERDVISAVRDGAVPIKDICLACLSKPDSLLPHPLFHGSICKPCLEKFKENYFGVGLDLIPYHCSICMNVGDMMVCSKIHCSRSYCCKCIAMKATLGVLDIIRQADPWTCFLCEPFTAKMHGLLKPHTSVWKRNMWPLFHSDVPSIDGLQKTPLNILCLDGSVETAFHVLSLLSSLKIEVDELFLCNYNDEETKKLQSMLPKQVSLMKSMHEIENYEALSKITPIQAVIASTDGMEKEAFGKYFFKFYNIVSMLNILNRACLQKFTLMWVLEAGPPHWIDYNILVARYLHFNQAKWAGKENFVWTNISVLWSFLEVEVEGEEAPSLKIDKASPKRAQLKPSGKTPDKKKAKQCT